MSRAFVKEPEGDQADDDLPERPQSEHPNYITQAGLMRLNERVVALRARVRELEQGGEDLSVRSELKLLEPELRYLEKRVQVAIPVDPPAEGVGHIRFGATVELADEDDRRHVFTIVGEDEADVDRGRISWVSPLGRELLNKEIGDVVTWQRPAGDLELEVLAFSYA